MKPFKTIEELLGELRYKSGPSEQDRMKGPIDEAWRRHEARQMILGGSQTSGTIFGTQLVKLVAAAALVVGGLAATVAILENSTGPAYALEQTVEAVKDIRYFHFRLLDQRQNKDKEAWVEYDPDGRLEKVRVNFLRMNSVMVWSRDVTQFLKTDVDELDIFNDMEYTDKILFFARRHDPKNAVEYLRKLEAEGAVRIEIGAPSGRPELIPVTVTYEPNTYMIGAPMPQMREVLHIDPATKLISYIDVSAHFKDKGIWGDLGVWEYLDYNQPFDPNIFDLEKEIGKDTTPFNTLGSDLGVEQGSISDAETAVKVAEEFLSAWKSKDYDRAVRIHGYTSKANRDEVLQMLNKSELLQIVEIGDPFPAERPMRGYCLSCTLELEQDSKVSKSKWQIYVRRSTPTRWRIGKVSPPKEGV